VSVFDKIVMSASLRWIVVPKIDGQDRSRRRVSS
jgi:hypothetical protein